MNPRYAVKGQIGAGGVGEVYLATDTKLDRDVAIKRVKPPGSGSAEALHADLIREARTLSSLQHPNIVTVYDVGQDEQGPFVVMEYLKGETLDQLTERGPLTLADFQEVVTQALEGMMAAQAMGLVHRDLKPCNLMVIWLASGKFQIKILDFGLAKFSRTATRQTEDHEAGIMGSIFFMAPEQFERLPLDARTDMYSLGCIFYQILTTKVPFDGATGPEVMVSHLQHHVRHMVEVRPDLPVWLADWVMWLISRDMEERPADARTALEYFKAGKSAIRNPTTPPAIVAGVKIVGRGTGPGRAGAGTSPPIQRGRTSSTQSLQGTMAAARSSRPAARKVKAKNHRILWISLAMITVAGGAAFWVGNPKAPAADPRDNLKTILNASLPPKDPASQALLIAALSSNDPDAPRAVVMLKNLKSPTIAKAAAEALGSTSGPGRLLLIDLLGTHPSKSATALLLKIAASEPGAARTAALESIAHSAQSRDVPDLLKILDSIKDAPSRARLLHAVDSLLQDEADPAIRAGHLNAALMIAEAGTRPDLLRLLGQTGHPEANKTLTAGITAGGERRREALSALPDWTSPDPAVLDAVLAAATSSPGERDALLTGFCLAAAHASQLSGEELTAMLAKARPLITSTKNREAFCAALSSTAAMEAAAYAKQLASDPDWAAPAGKAGSIISAALANLVTLVPGETHLDAAKASIQTSEKDAYYTSTSRYLTGWKNPGTRVTWDLVVTAPSKVSVKIQQSTGLEKKRAFRVRLGNDSNEQFVKPTGSSEKFTTVDAGSFQIPRRGTWRLWLEPARMDPGEPLFNVREVILSMP